MEWIDIASLKWLAAAIGLTIFSFIIPENLVSVLAVCASITTVVFNIHRFYESRKQKKNDRIPRQD